MQENGKGVSPFELVNRVEERREERIAANIVDSCWKMLKDCLLYTSPSPRDRSRGLGDVYKRQERALVVRSHGISTPPKSSNF